MATWLAGSWPDVVAVPTGYAMVRVAEDLQTVLCEVNGAEAWSVTTSYYPKWLRCAAAPDGTVKALAVLQTAAGVFDAYLFESTGATDLGVDVASQRGVVLTYESGDFVAYICDSKFTYVRYPLSGAPAAPAANPFTVTGTTLGMRDVVASVPQWDQDATTQTYATTSIAGVPFYHYMSRGTVTVGQSAGAPITGATIIASPDGVSVSTVIPVAGYDPHVAVLADGRTVIVARTATISGKNTAVFIAPPWPAFDGTAASGLAALAAGLYRQKVLKPDGIMTEAWYKLITGIANELSQPIDLGAAYVQGILPGDRVDLEGSAFDFVTATAGGITELTTDVTATGPGVAAATIPNNTVTYAKMQNVSAASRLLGRGSAAGAGDPEELTLGTGLSMSGTVVSATDPAGFARSLLLMGG